MPASLLFYLAAASSCLAVFGLLYRLLLARLTTFTLNRAYLLGALAGSLLLPLLPLPRALAQLLVAAPAPAGLPDFGLLRLSWPAAAPVVHAATPASPTVDWLWLGAWLVVGVYVVGALRRLLVSVRHVRALRALARQHPQMQRAGCTLVQLPAPDRPAFSFGRYVFLSPMHEALSAAERQQLLDHEQVHIRQRHTLDLLLAEAVSIALWFSGLGVYFQRQLKVVHEYLADAAVVREQASIVGYGELLVRLAAQQPAFALAHSLAEKPIFLRIQMLTQKPSSLMQKLRFLLVFPAIALTWAATASIGAPGTEPVTPTAQTTTPAPNGRIGRISWQGNTLVSATELTKLLGLKPGDAYDSAAVAQRLNYRADGQDVSSRYMDQGYLFFSVTPSVVRQANGTVDLTFILSEGRPAQLGNITIAGNTKISSAALLKLIPLRSGQPFSRARLLETQAILAKQGQFDPKRTAVNPMPVMRPAQATDQVDIALVVVEK
ncbi:POTRA domain-containing protein [Hymenobacter sp. ASUV-10]|uniref:POTRA domain-containing protein n=1 Tax=Hymenobacter aranciens TaxID=3063996 RepID=A0ABT9BD50_9BACT|nr:POTRA domain-containing protein [Hymenobacter sp. ASUV-10]MDO7875634.1 POTRA domain-containing protein [Hymenobacter sp. ASUV-10]